MIEEVTVDNLSEYAKDQHNYKEMPEGEDYDEGVVPEQTVPAEWWNGFFGLITKNVGATHNDLVSVTKELTNVLAKVGVTPDPLIENQLANLLSTGHKGNTIVLRDSEGQSSFSTPTLDQHAATKKYVDEHVPIIETNIILKSRPLDPIPVGSIWLE